MKLTYLSLTNNLDFCCSYTTSRRFYQVARDGVPSIWDRIRGGRNIVSTRHTSYLIPSYLRYGEVYNVTFTVMSKINVRQRDRDREPETERLVSKTPFSMTFFGIPPLWVYHSLTPEGCCCPLIWDVGVSPEVSNVRDLVLVGPIR